MDHQLDSTNEKLEIHSLTAHENFTLTEYGFVGHLAEPEAGNPHEVKTILYPHGSHLTGLMPNRAREKKLYRMIPLVGLIYKSFGRYRKENMDDFEQSENAIVAWITESGRKGGEK